MKALLSVSDKENIVEFAKDLISLGYEILSTGGTYKLLNQHAVTATEISELTEFPELFEGRVKTLHPKVHGALLYKRDKQEHLMQAKEQNIEPIDLVCVNLYPFKQTIQTTDDFDTIIENIDIGGPAMIRSAAKNSSSVLVVCDKNDYKKVIEHLKNPHANANFNQELMIKAFSHTAQYDATIANYLNERFHEGFGDQKFIVASKVLDTKYGENPHQKGALYEYEDFFKKHFFTLKGEASFNNMTDINSALALACAFGDKPAVSIVKHANACGFAIKNDVFDSYSEALKSDPISAYGGVVAINGKLDEKLANKINEIYVEVIIAANIDEEALKVFENKKRIKIFTQKQEFLSISHDKYDFKPLNGGFVYQQKDKIQDQEVTQAKCMSVLRANEEQMQDMLIAWKLAALTKSNSIVYVKNSALVAIGMGMTSRVDASRAALNKAKDLGIDIKGSVMASEAFFPFRDSIDLAFKEGVKVVIEPGGSIRDDEVITAANEHEMALYFTGKRHFLH